MDTKREHRAHAEGSPRGNPYDLTYSPSGRLIGRYRDIHSVTLSASAEMAYGYCDNYQPHAVKRMYDYNSNMLYDMRWDDAGNLGQVSKAKPGNICESGRFLFWTEDNRMHAAIDDKYYSYYAYDHNGERRIKLVGDNELLDVNADFMSTYTLQNAPTLYPSAYMVLTNKGYTKHYYAGTERVAARMGGGGLDAMGHAIGNNDTLQEKADLLYKQSLDQVNNRVLNKNDLDCIMDNVFAKEEFGHWIDGIPYQMQAGVELNHDQFKDMMNSMLSDFSQGDEPDVYFYHSDLCKSREQSQAGLSYAETQQSVRSKHLGSASWITDFNGIAVQHLQYLPYGEPYINQHLSSYNERFTFTGKESDEETGYGYFGARYMDHELMTMWLSVDPMADKYPSISPYAYCSWNPVKLVDPTGKEWKDADGNIITDHSKIKVYIFYDPYAFKKQSLKMYKDAEAKYGKGSVALSNVTTETEFAQDWKNMASPDIKEVNLNYHGNNQTLMLDSPNEEYITSTGDGLSNRSGKSATNVQDLSKPVGKISDAQLNINSCKSNSRTQYPLKGSGQTLMEAFANTFVFKSIRGTSAGVSYNKFTKKPEPQHYYEHWDYIPARQIPTPPVYHTPVYYKTGGMR